MTTDEMTQALEDFSWRIRLVQKDFARLLDDFLNYEEEAACGYCGKRGAEGMQVCKHCGAGFCPGCWEKAREVAVARKGLKKGADDDPLNV